MGVGIPTEYAGVRMRSRLEARWAAFFDRVGWPWAYEPLDLNGYIPDFALLFEDHGRKPLPILVEIKPELYIASLYGHTDKIDQSEWKHEALILGAIVWPQDSMGEYSFGLLRDRDASWAPAVGVMCRCCESLSFTSRTSDGPGRCRACGCMVENDHCGLDVGWVHQAFTDASNEVQWKGAFNA